MKPSKISSSLFKKNRENFIANMQPGSAAIILSNDEFPRSGDQAYPYRQNPDLFYLTGIDNKNTSLLLYPDSPIPAYREVLFIEETSEITSVWEGNKYNQEEASEISGIKNILYNGVFSKTIDNIMPMVNNAYLAITENPLHTGSGLNYSNLRFANELKQRYPLHNYLRAAPLLAGLRSIKSNEETGIIKRAIDITTSAFSRLLKLIRPGVMEHEIEAEIIHEFIKNRATGHAFQPIIASGANACILHYTKNNDTCRNNELLLLDIGAEFGNYASDISRTIPVNGRFSERQKKVYSSVLRVFKEVRNIMTPGVSIDSCNKEAGKMIESELINLGLLDKTGIKNQIPGEPLYKRYFPHGVSHFIGLDVHDPGNRFEALQPGMIISCEPGIYIKEEALGVRIENMIMITENKPADLTLNVPIEIEDIEERMKPASSYL